MENNSDDASSEEKQNLKFVPEPIKRLIAMGVGAAFLTEEIVDRVGDELVSIIKKIDFVEEASRFVEGHKFRISAEIEVLKRSSDEESVEVSASTKIKS